MNSLEKGNAVLTGEGEREGEGKPSGYSSNKTLKIPMHAGLSGDSSGLPLKLPVRLQSYRAEWRLNRLQKGQGNRRVLGNIIAHTQVGEGGYPCDKQVITGKQNSFNVGK